MEEIPTSFRFPGLGMDALLIVHTLLLTRKKNIQCIVSSHRAIKALFSPRRNV